jgi:hypothetical protein
MGSFIGCWQGGIGLGPLQLLSAVQHRSCLPLCCCVLLNLATTSCLLYFPVCRCSRAQRGEQRQPAHQQQCLLTGNEQHESQVFFPAALTHNASSYAAATYARARAAHGQLFSPLRHITRMQLPVY